jgi:hypothetical protein
MAQKKSNLPIGYTPPKRGERIKASDIQGIAKAVKRLTRQGREIYPTAFPSPLELPFEIYIGNEIPEGGTTPEVFIGARDGVFDGASLTNIKEYSPANGTWTLQAKIVINANTGEITSREVLFLDTPGTQTATDFFATIGLIQVVDGVPNPSTIIQANYGPLYNILYGGPNEKWKAAIF